MATRTSLQRLNNDKGHSYTWSAFAGCHLCIICGTAEHQTGWFYHAGCRSQIEPPCEDEAEYKEWKLIAESTVEE